MSVRFEDNRVAVKSAMEKKAIAWLHEAAGEIVSQTQRNLSKIGGRWFAEQKNDWSYKVDESKLEATIGGVKERDLWTEFGTGSFADGGKGRKGWWVYVKGENGSETTTSSSKKSYTLDEAKQIMAMLRADGLDAHITRGQKPKRPFETAYKKLKPNLIKQAEKLFGGTWK